MCKCGFVIGNTVILKYPEKSTWNDLPQGLIEGRVILNGKHIITRIRHHYDSPSLCEVQVRTMHDTLAWSCNAAVYIKYNKHKRNLPEWF